MTNNAKPDKAFLLAAGKGTRLRPYTDHMPKPMVTVNGQSIIRRAIEKLRADGVRQIVVNIHHLAPILRAHLQEIKDPQIILSEEEELLDTGGGVKKALSVFEDKPFYMINGDALWSDEADMTALSRLACLWDDTKMDLLLLLQPVSGMTLTNGVGDYHLSENGKTIRTRNKDGDHMFAGIRIVHPRLFDNTPDGAFSFLSLMDRAEEQGRLYGIAHRGEWHHISTPAELERVDAAYRERGADA